MDRGLVQFLGAHVLFGLALLSGYLAHIEISHELLGKILHDSLSIASLVFAGSGGMILGRLQKTPPRS